MQILTLFLVSDAVLCGAVQVARVVPSPVGDASQMVKHNAYVDSKVRQVVANFLNHDKYHQRKVVFPSSASVLPSFASNFTSTAVSSSFTSSASKQSSSSSSASIDSASPSGSAPLTLQPGLTLPPSNSSVGAFTNVTNDNDNTSAASVLGDTAAPSAGSGASYLSRHAHAGNLQITKNLALPANAVSSWENETDNACSTQLTTLGGVATNPSGVSACYNIRSLENNTGVFHADLRLYRIAAAKGDWTQMQSDGFSAGIAYPDASVRLEGYVQKRDLAGFIGPVRREGAARLAGRSTKSAPPLLQTLSFLGQVNNGSIPELHIEGIAFALLTPQINLAGSTSSGSPISTLLSLQDASFVNGLFVALHSSQVGTAAIMAIGSSEWVSKANSFSSFPVSLVIVGAWNLLMLMLEGFDLGKRIRCRNEDLRRMRKGEKGGVET